MTLHRSGMAWQNNFSITPSFSLYIYSLCAGMHECCDASQQPGDGRMRNATVGRVVLFSSSFASLVGGAGPMQNAGLALEVSGRQRTSKWKWTKDMMTMQTRTHTILSVAADGAEAAGLSAVRAVQRGAVHLLCLGLSRQDRLAANAAHHMHHSARHILAWHGK